MVRSKIRVVLRTRPSAQFAADAIKILPDKQSVQLHVKSRLSANVGVTNHSQEQFQVLHNTSQEGVFEVCAKDAVTNLLDGYNSTIMAYGQTGAGKTYTMTGGRTGYQQVVVFFNSTEVVGWRPRPQRGLVPRCIADLFNQTRARPQSAVTVRISYCEIYNENFYDLLHPNDKMDISVQEDAKGGVHVKGLSSRVVNSEEEALSLLFEGETNRAIAEHQLNEASSRSHTVFTMALEIRPQGTGDERVLVSKMHLVDLAGSERLSKTKSEGTVAREAQYINKSLSLLEQVIMALGNKNREHIPYRSSKLTHLLKDSLGGNAKTLVIANVWGEAAHLDETLSTCKFAQRMQRITNEVAVNFRQDPEMLVRKYEREIRELKQELSMHDAMGNRSRTNYDPYTEVQRLELKDNVLDFLTGPQVESTDPLELTSLRHIREILYQCRILYQAKLGPAAGISLPHRLEAVAESTPSTAAVMPVDESDSYVGDLDMDQEKAAVGVAPSDARPSEHSYQTPRTARTEGDSRSQLGTPDTMRVVKPPLDKNEAFLIFKGGEGYEVASALAANKAELKEKRQRMRELATSINATKHLIDTQKGRVDEIRAQCAAQGGETSKPSKDEIAILIQMKELKQKYRDEHQELNMIKAEVEYTAPLCKECTKQLVREFEKWYSAEYGTTLSLAAVNASPSTASYLAKDDDEEEETAGPVSNEDAYVNAQRAQARKHAPGTAQSKASSAASRATPRR